jgi:hypothetical protein
VVLARGYLFLGDIAWQDEPFCAFYSSCIRAGRLPFWNPYIFGGFPQFAEGQTATLYPLSALASLLLPPYAALTWLVVLHRLLAGVFMFLFARSRELSRSSSFIAALVFMFSGFLFGLSQNWGYGASAAYLPLLLCFLEWGLRTRRPIYALPAAATLTLQFLIGAPPITFLSAFTAFVYVALRVMGRDARRVAGPAAVLVLGTFLLGAALAAVQIWPTLAVAQASLRTVQSRFDFMTTSGLPPALFASFLAPDTWGNPAYGNYHGPQFYWLFLGYVGLAALALAGAGAVGRFSRNWPFAALAVIAAALALGGLNPVYHVLQYVPGFNMFRVPARYLLVITFCLAALAGEGHEHLLGRAGGHSRWASWAGACALLLAAWALLQFGLLPPASR